MNYENPDAPAVVLVQKMTSGTHDRHMDQNCGEDCAVDNASCMIQNHSAEMFDHILDTPSILRYVEALLPHLVCCQQVMFGDTVSDLVEQVAGLKTEV